MYFSVHFLVRAELTRFVNTLIMLCYVDIIFVMDQCFGCYHEDSLNEKDALEVVCLM